ncbi:MAG: glycosyltransferase family 2 protein [Planctomycetes bacterium]|nr:glycosyltransferase family 2 protein [Planctomycetota bacterium]
MNRKYVIVTPAHNEADHLPATVASVLRQTVPPCRWVVVDDGSTDETPALLAAWVRQHEFLQYHRRLRDGSQSYFASNVYAIMEGVRQVETLDYEFLAVLDAEITLPPDYYEQILARFEADPALGVASGIYENLIAGRLHKVMNDRRSTPKAIQVFRRSCFEQIGGYIPLKYGAEDTCACLLARLRGWKAWSFPELKVIHRRPTGLGNAKSILRASFELGLQEYGLGSHPLFVLTKYLRRAFLEKPYGVRAAATLAGFLYGSLRAEKRQISRELVRFARREQLARVWNFNRIPRTCRWEGSDLRAPPSEEVEKPAHGPARPLLEFQSPKNRSRDCSASRAPR